MEDLYKAKLETINTYLQDQDSDINNIELMQSNIMEEVQHIKNDMHTIKTGTFISVILLGLIFGMMLSERIRRTKK